MDRRLRVEARLRAGGLRAVVATASAGARHRRSARWSSCASSDRRGASPLSSSASDELSTMSAAFRSAACTRSRGTSWWSARRFSPRSAPATRRRRAPTHRTTGRSRATTGGRVRRLRTRGLHRRGALGARSPVSSLHALDSQDFETIVELVSQGVVTGRGRRGAHLHRDRVNGVLRPRRGARLTAVTSGGAIPDVADFRVVLEAGRHSRRHSQRGLGDRVDGGRRVPSSQRGLADPEDRARHGPGGRCPRGVTERPVLARRGTGANRRAVPGGLRLAQCCRDRPPSRARRGRHRRGHREGHRGRRISRRGRSRRRPAGGRLSGGRLARARRLADDRTLRDRAVLRRHRRDAARRSFTPRRE